MWVSVRVMYVECVYVCVYTLQSPIVPAAQRFKIKHNINGEKLSDCLG